MNKYFYTLCFLSFGFILHSNAQKLTHIQGDIILQLVDSATPDDVIGLARGNRDVTWRPIKGGPFNLFLLHTDFTKVNENEYIRELHQHPLVLRAQKNKIITQRAIPNDTLFNRQWQYINIGTNGGKIGADIDADLAWDITTGGTTALGDRIVACIVDDGFDTNHEDASNLWVNKGEIPNDSIDNDGNGYIDDVYGWNFQDGNNDISRGGGHGTPVAGIIGARGNNNVGVAGVNWDVDLMIIKYESNISESSVLESYSYAYDQRKKYNDTDGAEGAFVVVINSSWGIDEGDPNDAPIWCDFYDELGEIGILSCGATANDNLDVDVDGDLPTACSSDYLISVTNLNAMDRKVQSAAYGRVSIDIGAFGEGTYTMASNNRYNGFGGTSGATPHVAGAVALLYAAPCDSLIRLAKLNPGKAALVVKEHILNGAASLGELDGITTSRGRLNLANSLTNLEQWCTAVGVGHNYTETSSIDGIIFNWELSVPGLITDIRVRAFDETDWQTYLNVSSGFSITGLDYCSLYEYQYRTYQSGTTVPFGYSKFIETEGCCYINNVASSILNDNRWTINFNPSDGSITNILAYRNYGDTTWKEIELQGDFFSVSNIEDCSLIQYRYLSICKPLNNFSDTSEIFTINSDCGECTTNEYCDVENLTNSDEWIESFSINGEVFVSGKGSEHSIFTGGFVPRLKSEGKYEVIFTPGYRGNSFSESYKVFIDLNGDGDFEDEEEEVYVRMDGKTGELVDSLQIPFTSYLGLTRMRIIMRFSVASGDACGPLDASFGEAEDYCIELVDGSVNVDPISIANNDFRLYPTLGEESFSIIGQGNIKLIESYKVYNTSGVLIIDQEVNSKLVNVPVTHWSQGMYMVRISGQGYETVKRFIKI